jgi:hypothetical protein
MPYQYRNLKEIDAQTLDYLEFVVPKPLDEMSIDEINDFLNTLEEFFLELDGNAEYA